MSLLDFFVGTAILDDRDLDKQTLIARLVVLLAGSGELPLAAVPEVLAAVLRREQLGSTGIGRGLALPHARRAGLSRLLGVLAICRTPVAFDSIDAEPVDIVAFILAPTDQLGRRLRYFDQMCRHLRQDEFLRALRAAATPAELAALLEDAGDPPVGRVPCPLPSAATPFDIRKARLFGCACARHLGNGTDPDAVERTERFADGLVPTASALLRGVAPLPRSVLQNEADAVLGGSLAWATAEGLSPAVQADLLRDIFAPAQLIPFDPSWLAWNNGAVPRVAATIYEERTFADLPILADALEDAGCADVALLEHLRESGPHQRGCWALDLLLNKE